MTSNAAGNRRASYLQWLAALDEAARQSAKTARPVAPGTRFALCLELRLWMPSGQGSDLDNYVKPIQDKLADHGIFGVTRYSGSSMTGMSTSTISTSAASRSARSTRREFLPMCGSSVPAPSDMPGPPHARNLVHDRGVCAVLRIHSCAG